MLVADLYELTMAAAYHRQEMLAPATFSLFIRRLPPERGFLVAAGVDEALDRLVTWRIEEQDVAWLSDRLRMPADDFAPLVGTGFTGDAWAVPDGTVVLAGEPVLEVTAPLPEAQIVESTVLNAVTYQTAIATKAVRCRLAAAGRPVIDFSLRRDHGVEAAVAAARATAIAGFAATSNLAAASRHQLKGTGTMAHSFVQAFESEHAAFEAFAETFPESPTFLVDTYDTAGGVRTAIAVITSRGLQDRAAIRLDSGDLAAEATAARDLLDAAGLSKVRIVVSGGVDEYLIDDMVRSGAPIDVFAAGTRVGVVDDAPVLDSAYKLVEYAGQPITKLSPGKGYPPGRKQVWRRARGPDVIGRREEGDPVGTRPLLHHVVLNGRRLRPSASLEEARQQVSMDLGWLAPGPDEIRRPVPRAPVISDPLQHLHDALRSRLLGRTP